MLETCKKHETIHNNGCLHCEYEKEKEGKGRFNAVVIPRPANRKPNELPEKESIVLAIVQHWDTKNKRYAILKSVKEDDCSFRLTDDNSELSYDWNVIAWDYLEKEVV